MASRPAATITDAQRLDWLRLLRTDNVGPATFRQLLNRFGAADAALDALPDMLRRTGKPLRIPTRSEAEDEIAGLSRYGARLVASGEPDYPPLLAYIPAAPPLLTMAGGQNLDWLRTVAIVGARNASAAGIKMARILAGDLGERLYRGLGPRARHRHGRPSGKPQYRHDRRPRRRLRQDLSRREHPPRPRHPR